MCRWGWWPGKKHSVTLTLTCNLSLSGTRQCEAYGERGADGVGGQAGVDAERTFGYANTDL